MTRVSLSHAELRALIVGMPANGQTLLVSVDGPGGSGKSTVARALAAETGWPVVHVDDFYQPRAERYHGPAEARPLAADFDLARLERQVLEPLSQGRAAHYQRYDWERDTLGKSVDVTPGGVVIIEGVYSGLACLRARYACRIWVECPRETRLRRGLARDGEAARALWVDDWMPQEDKYIAAEQPRLGADVVVLGGDHDGLDPAQRVLIQHMSGRTKHE